MDTILSNIPMPKVFLSTQIVDRATIRTVIDGQQRINAIIDFLNDEFCLGAPYEGEYAELTFSQLPKKVQDDFLAYRIDYNEVQAISQEEIREIYSRVNKYSFPLNQQELRKADYPGQFLNLAEKLSGHSFFESIRIFSVANRRRLGDVEYISELLVAMLAGPQERKETLDDFYMRGAKWTNDEFNIHHDMFESILDEMQILNSKFRFANSRFKQKSDFYALFVAIHQLILQKGTLKGKNLKFLVEDLHFLQDCINPNSEFPLLREYAVKCVSQANSKASREWRSNFLQNFISGTFLNAPPSSLALFTKLKEDTTIGDAMCSPQIFQCANCHMDFSEKEYFDKVELTWPNNTTEYQFSNSEWKHKKCSDEN